METAIASGFLKPGEFPVVTSFHCLEHVSQPVEFVRELLRATARGGSLFLSTPYSPMSFETEWFDVMNHPPHHMTRWNLAAYRKLAEILGVKMRHFCPAQPAAQAGTAIVPAQPLRRQCPRLPENSPERSGLARATISVPLATNVRPRPAT